MTTGAAGPARAMTLEEWAALDEEVEGELVDGILEEEEMPSFLHEIVVAWLRAEARSSRRVAALGAGIRPTAAGVDGAAR